MDLNGRQQKMLKAIFDTDQAFEVYYRQEAARGFYPPKASVWRWMVYSTLQGIDSDLKRTLRHAHLIDPGTGSTWEVLESRKLIDIRYQPTIGDPIPEIKITSAGRKLARSWTGETARKARLKGQLAERQWAARVRLWQAGAEGIDSDTLLYSKGGFGWMPTLYRLDRYKPAPLIAYHNRTECYHITEAGKAHYCDFWQTYQQLYPNVEAPEPEEVSYE